MNINMAGQTINDRLLAARHSLAGQGLAKSVCKATTEEMIGPKKKHLDCKCAVPFPSVGRPPFAWGTVTTSALVPCPDKVTVNRLDVHTCGRLFFCSRLRATSCSRVEGGGGSCSSLTSSDLGCAKMM